jgi:hypothetical protein
VLLDLGVIGGWAKPSAPNSFHATAESSSRKQTQLKDSSVRIKHRAS